MKKVLFIIVAALTFASCQKSDLKDVEQQRSHKVKEQALTVTALTTLGEDAIVSIDSAKWTTESVGTGNQVYWSVRGDDSLLPSFAGVVVQVWIEAGWVDKWGVSSPASHWTTVGQDWSLVYSPGGMGKIFDGYPGQVETRIYRAQLIDKNGVVHYSSAYQI